MLGGANRYTPIGFDEARARSPNRQPPLPCVPTDRGFESGALTQWIPGGRSFFVETLTNEVEAAAWQLMEKIDAMGEAISASEQGFIQDELPRALTNTSGRSMVKVVLGINRFQNEKTIHPATLKIDDSVQQVQWPN